MAEAKNKNAALKTAMGSEKFRSKRHAHMRVSVHAIHAHIDKRTGIPSAIGSTGALNGSELTLCKIFWWRGHK
jgi:hypothetical protein